MVEAETARSRGGSLSIRGFGAGWEGRICDVVFTLLLGGRRRLVGFGKRDVSRLVMQMLPTRSPSAR
jgi:hypothetical protein